MNPTTPPAFQFYPRQWLADDKVMLMSWEARAMHMHLICICWQQTPACTLPDDDDSIKAWLGHPKDFERLKTEIFRAWKKVGGRWQQDGLLRVYLKQKAYSESRKANASHPHKAYAKHMQSTGTAQEEEDEDEVSSSGKEGVGGKPLPRNKGFVPPSVAHCRDEAVNLGLPADQGDQFHAYYKSTGWMRGKSAIRDWTATMIGWKDNWLKKNYPNGTKPSIVLKPGQVLGEP